jgi:SAM-dependent methyltransferase
MKLKYLLKGIIKSIPGIERIYNFHTNTGGTNSARYCYSVWLRHLTYAHEKGLRSLPEKIAELGPGDSLGIGLSALISGSEQYFGLDIVKYTDAEVNLKVFDELVILFKNKTPIPDENEFPLLKPKLMSYYFPDHILTDDHMSKMMDEVRLKRIRNSIKALDLPLGSIEVENSMVVYKAPWNDAVINSVEEVDMILSQAVLQHIDELAPAYKQMNKWLKPGGFMSHVLDFKSMGSSDNWYGHLIQISNGK